MPSSNVAGPCSHRCLPVQNCSSSIKSSNRHLQPEPRSYARHQRGSRREILPGSTQQRLETSSPVIRKSPGSVTEFLPSKPSDLDIEMRRVKGTLRGLDPTLLRVKGHRDLTDPTLTLAGSDPGILQGRAIRVSGSRAGSRVP
jgi:hypothetical protein